MAFVVYIQLNLMLRKNILFFKLIFIFNLNSIQKLRQKTCFSVNFLRNSRPIENTRLTIGGHFKRSVTTMTDHSVIIINKTVINSYEDKFRSFERLLQSTKELFFGPKMDLICDRLTQLVDYLLSESINQSVVQSVATLCLRSVAASVKRPDSNPRIDLIIEERVHLFTRDVSTICLTERLGITR